MGSSRSEKQMTKKYHVLIADDDNKLSSALAVRLESAGFEASTAQDAYAAVAMAKRDHPDLLLLDINMPAGSGMSVGQRLHSDETFGSVPIIFMTGEDSERICQLAEEYGANLSAAAVLRKPFEHAPLIALIHEMVTGHKAVA